MATWILLVIFVSSVVAVPTQKQLDNDVDKFITLVPENNNLVKTDSIKRNLKKHSAPRSVKNVTIDGILKRSRKERTFFLNQLHHPRSEQAYLETPSKQNYQESNVYYIKLPPTPYIFVPGLGYISQPPTYSFSTKDKPLKFSQNQVPIVKLPIDFISNGKPTSVYSYSKTDNNSKQSPMVNLDKGPYVFNGSPVSFYLMDSNGKSLIKRTFKYNNYMNYPRDYY